MFLNYAMMLIYFTGTSTALPMSPFLAASSVNFLKIISSSFAVYFLGLMQIAPLAPPKGISKTLERIVFKAAKASTSF